MGYELDEMSAVAMQDCCTTTKQGKGLCFEIKISCSHLAKALQLSLQLIIHMWQFWLVRGPAARACTHLLIAPADMIAKQLCNTQGAAAAGQQCP